MELCRYASSKYTRSKVRKLLPEDFKYIIEEFLNEHVEQVQQNMFSDIVEYNLFTQLTVMKKMWTKLIHRIRFLACIKKLRIVIMNDLETCDFNTVNLERFGFLF